MKTARGAEIRAVSFDGDMTLWDFEKVMRHSLRLVLGELRRRVPGRRTAELTIDRLVQIRNEVAAEVKGATPNLERVRLRAFERTLETIGRPDPALAGELNALYLQHRFEDIELYPDVLPCLDALRPRCALGLLSNGNGYPERCGLPGRFDFVFFAQDVGATKPDAAMFHAACRQAGCHANELMHVGDSLATDVAGANGVGAISVWLNRARARNDSAVFPNFEVRSLVEVPGLVADGTPAGGRSG